MKEVIINLTQHLSTPEQREEGLVDLPELERKQLQELLTLDTIPTRWDLIVRAEKIADIAVESGAKMAMIGGHPAMMAPLENAISGSGIAPVYSFSERVSTEETLPDGSVRKVNHFKHVGFF